jgi:pyruvate dehydrogenase E1 component alpha subunit
MAVRKAAERALEHARSGKGPFLLEMKTYRYRGHSMSDPAKYRPKDEPKQVRDTRDPIEHMRHYGLENGLFTEEDLKTIDRDVKEIVADAADFAQTSPEPDPSELMRHIYVEA